MTRQYNIEDILLLDNNIPSISKIVTREEKVNW